MVKLKYMSVPVIPHVFFLLGTLTCIHVATVDLLNASCSEITFIFNIYPRKAYHFYNCLPAKIRNYFDNSGPDKLFVK